MMSADKRQPLIRGNPNWYRTSRKPSINSVRRTLSQESSLPESITQQAPAIDWKVRVSCVCILSAVVCERVSYYGLNGNLVVLFLNKDPFMWESYNARPAFFFSSVTYIFALLGGWIADSCLGRFKSMFLAFLVYICGYMILPFIAEKSENPESPKFIGANRSSALPKICANSFDDDENGPFTENCASLFFITLLIIAVGNGILKSNIVPFGSDQLTQAGQQTQMSFFNWFYWCVNVGSFLGLSAMTYTEQQVNFHLGYNICTGFLGLAFLLFLSGSCCYERRVPDGRFITNIFRIIQEASERRNERKQLRRINQSSPTVHQTSTVVDEASTSNEEGISFLDYAKHRYGGAFHNSLVDDVKKVKVILLVFAVLIPYWVVYFQMQTTFLVQALHMKLEFETVERSLINDTTPLPSTPTTVPSTIVSSTGNENLPLTPLQKNSVTGKPQNLNNALTWVEKPEIVVAWFTLFDVIFVIVLLPLFDRVIYPRMARAGYPFTFTKRIVLGMVFAMAAMFVAGIVEHYRLKAFWPNPDLPCVVSIHQDIGNTTYYAADMSVLWQIPQYALIGISEVFASVACLQFAVSVAPRSMKALITGFFYFFSVVGSFIGTVIINILASSETWFFKNDFGNIYCRIPCNNQTNTVIEHECHLDYYFYLLGGLEAFGLFLFLLVAYKYRLNTDELIATNGQIRVRQPMNVQAPVSSAPLYPQRARVDNISSPSLTPRPTQAAPTTSTQLPDPRLQTNPPEANPVIASAPPQSSSASS